VLILSWNVAGRISRIAEQLERVLELDADVVCLQELTARSLPLWRERLSAHGYLGIEHAPLPAAPDRARALGVLTATRAASSPTRVADVPWSERVLAVRLRDGTEVVNVHSPTSPKPDLVKVRTHEAVHRHLAISVPSRLRILCGDLNTPRKEHADGRVWTFARDRFGRLRADRGERWDQAELSLIRGLNEHGFSDAFRSLHGYQRRELSWEWRRWGGGYRLDHLLVAGHAEVVCCRYEHDWRTAGLSDHSALVAELRPAARG
jgi:exonuclease III